MAGRIKKADVVVIGGGAVGTAAAYHLSSRGKKVILCEARNIASGATGRCGGMIVHCYGRDVNIDKTDYRLLFTRANTEIMKEYQKTFEIDFQLRQVGCLDIAISEKEYDDLERLVKIQHSLGDDGIVLLDKKETLSEMPNLNPELIFGSRLRKEDGNLNPFLLARAQAVEAQKLGAQVLLHTKVDEIIMTNNEVQGVRVNDSVIEAENVVNATNGWASLLTEGIEVIPVRELAMVTERLPELPPQPFEMLCLGDFAYGATQTATGNYNLGGPGPARPPDYDYYDEKIYADEVLRVMSYIAVIFPGLSGVSVIRSWVGAMGFTPDGMPSIGPMPGVKGLFITAGYPAGMSWAAVSGRLAAEYICEKQTSLPIGSMDPGRFIGKPKIKWPQPYDLTVCHDFLTEGAIA
ncbi:MAG TPA: FAD-binding oxidoreductase [Spirochaetes bacterium]|nr:FAD-binding oxidoreductase [Spirochaetota bacterium]